MNRIPIQEAAVKYDRSRQFFQKLIKKEKIRAIKIKNRVMIEEESLAEYFNTKPKGVEKVQTGKRISEKDEKNNKGDKDLDFSKPLTLLESRATIEKHGAFHKAEKDRIANEVKLGELLSKADIEDKSFTLWRQVRDEIQALSDRVAVKIRASDSNHEATKILRDETHRILKSIIDGYENIDDETIKKKLLLHLT
ncbi:MAG: helix-turn-helix domain-containing protein [Victivallales bacterium]|nr:helix-turn-helix domain-containing protein [Victivallales bacterium]